MQITLIRMCDFNVCRYGKKGGKKIEREKKRNYFSVDQK